LRHLKKADSRTTETPAHWAGVSAWLKSPEELESWRVLALVVARLHNPDAVDPVSALAAFLQKTTFAMDNRGLTLEIPDDLKVRLPDSAMLSVHLQPATDEKSVVLELRNTGDSKRDDQRRVRIYTFRPGDKQRLTYRPGDTLWAELPVG